MLLLSFLPIIGPIIQGLVDAFSKHEDVTLQRQIDTNKTALGKQADDNKTDVSVLQTRAQVAIAFKDDIGSRLIRDLIMFPVGVWTAFYFFYLTFHNVIEIWKIEEAAANMQYIPYAVIAFLFVTAYRGK